MKKLIIILSAAFYFICSSNVRALDCPQHPQQFRKDWDTEVSLAVAKIGTWKGADLSAKVYNATQDLLGKLPNADRLYLEQMMYATFCSSLRDDKSLTETEKTKRINDYNDSIRRAFAVAPSKINKKEINKEQELKLYSRATISGTLSITTHARTDLFELARTLGIEAFDLSLDDSILDDYYVIKLHLKNGNTALIQPLTLVCSTGTKDSKILNIQHKVNKPLGKKINIKNSIPVAQWIWPGSVINMKLCLEDPLSGQEGIGFNLYRSLLSDSGYGQINIDPIISTCSDIIETATSDLYPAYYKVSLLDSTRSETDLSSPFEMQNALPIKSFIRKTPSGNKEVSTYSSLSGKSLDESELEFARGRVEITFVNGLDADADIDIFLLCKLLPGSKLIPSVLLEGNPSVNFSLTGKAPFMQTSAVHFIPDTLRASLTPNYAKFYASSNSIYLVWEKPTAKEFNGVHIYRTPERTPGDLQTLRQEDEIYSGPGLTTSIELRLPELTKGFQSLHSTRSVGNLRYNIPAHKPDSILSSVTLSTSKLIKPAAPLGLTISSEEHLSSDYFVDTSLKSNTIFTYVIFGYDKDGNISYPVFVNASLSEPGAEEIVVNSKK